MSVGVDALLNMLRLKQLCTVRVHRPSAQDEQEA